MINGFRCVLSEDQAKNSDRYTISKLLISEDLLVECVGHSIAEEVHIPEEVIIFVGPGNNGADALAAARHLISLNLKILVVVISKRESLKFQCEKQLKLLEHINDTRDSMSKLFTYKIFPKESEIKKICSNISKGSVIIDGIFGAGLNKSPEGLALSAIRAINNIYNKAKILAIDIPSGLSLNARKPLGEAIKAHKTITFNHLKEAHISEPTKIFCGDVIVKNIGLFDEQIPSLFHYSKKIPLNHLLKPVSKISHKVNFGRVLIMEGEPKFMGASRLAARSALRAGAGLVSILVSDIKNHHPSDLAEFIKINLKDISSSDFDSLVVGPGLSKDEHFQELALDIINSAIKKNVKMIVLDACGLKLLSKINFQNSSSLCVCTPHPKEAAELLKIATSLVEEDRFLAIKSLRALHQTFSSNIIWVLKGATTLVAAPSGEIYSFAGDAPVLSTGGSGDILSGAIAGLSAQTNCVFDAVLLAISLQISAAFEKESEKGILPHELADSFPKLLKRIVVNE